MILRIFACVILTIAAVDLANGFLNLIANPHGGGDLHMRWTEQQYVFARQNPYDLLTPDISPSNTGRNRSINDDLGVPGGVSYPPWAFAVGNLLYWPPWPTVRFYFAALQALTMAGIFCYARSVGARAAVAHLGIVLALAAMANSANSMTIGLGQFSLLAMAGLAATEYFFARRRPALAGIALAFAWSKPNISLLFAVPFLINLLDQPKRRIAGVTLFSAVMTIALCSAVIWWQTHTPTLEMTRQWLDVSKTLPTDWFGLIGMLRRFGISSPTANSSAAAFCTVASIALIFLWRRSNLLVHFAIATVAGRYWAYHRNYDNVMFLFLQLALGRAAMTGRRPMVIAAFVLVCAASVIPVRFLTVWLAYFQIVAWLGGLVVLLIAEPRSGRRAGE